VPLREVIVLLLVLASGACRADTRSPASSAPSSPSANETVTLQVWSPRDIALDNAAIRAFQKGLGDLETSDPTAALDQYRHFAAARSFMSDVGMATVDASMAKLMYGQLHAPDGAIAVCDAFLQRFPYSDARFKVLAVEVSIMSRERRFAQMEATVAPMLAKPDRGDVADIIAVAVPYFAALAAEGKGSAAADQIVSLFCRRPLLLDPNNSASVDGMYDTLVDSLIAVGKPDEALGWAKLRFAICAVAKTDLLSAARELARAWTAAGDDGAHVAAFADALKGAATPNPLLAVKLPALDSSMLLANYDRMDVHERINVLIALGYTQQALNEALSRPGGSTVPDPELGRVYKALDLNLARAN